MFQRQTTRPAAAEQPWSCRCGWQGATPSMSDASYVRLGYDGELIHERVHIAVCPVCFHAVRREQPALPDVRYDRTAFAVAS